MALVIKNLPANTGDIRDPWVGKIPWRRAWQPTPVFLPGESHGERSLADYNSWGHKRFGHNWRDLARAYSCNKFLNFFGNWCDINLKYQRATKVSKTVLFYKYRYKLIGTKIQTKMRVFYQLTVILWFSFLIYKRW